MKRFLQITRKNSPAQIIKAIVLFFLLIEFFSPVMAQDLISRKNHVDLGIDYYSSGNGHGAFYAPTIFFNKKFNALGVSPLIQKRSMQLGGLKISYVRNLTGGIKDNFEDDSLTIDDSLLIAKIKSYSANHKHFLQLNYYTYVQYTKALPLSADVVRIEQLTHRDKSMNWNQITMNTGEIGGGFELQFNFNNSFSLKAYAGMSLYHHLTYKQKLENERTAMVLTIGSCLTVSMDSFGKLMKQFHHHQQKRHSFHNENILSSL